MELVSLALFIAAGVAAGWLGYHFGSFFRAWVVVVVTLIVAGILINTHPDNYITQFFYAIFAIYAGLFVLCAWAGNIPETAFDGFFNLFLKNKDQ